MNFSPLTFINAKSKRCILSSCLLRLCNSLFELAPRGFVPESECKSTATFPNYQTFCRLFSGNFLRRTARKHAKPHEHSNLYTKKKIQKKKNTRNAGKQRKEMGKEKARRHMRIRRPPGMRGTWFPQGQNRSNNQKGNGTRISEKQQALLPEQYADFV